MPVATESLTTTIHQTLAALGLEAENPGAFDGELDRDPRRADRIAQPGDRRAARRRAPGDRRGLRAGRRARPSRAFAGVADLAGAAPRRGRAPARRRAARATRRSSGALVTLETGKIRSEGEGEVQEMIDMCDFAVGLSRQLYGLTIACERPQHRMIEQWHPLGPVGIITAFNFPVAVWAWNAMVAAVCGDYDGLEAVARGAAHRLAVHADRPAACCRATAAPAIFNLCVGRADRHRRADGRRPPAPAHLGHRLRAGWAARSAEVVAERLGRSLLELGGNNAIIVIDDADLDLALRAVALRAPSAPPASAARPPAA